MTDQDIADALSSEYGAPNGKPQRTWKKLHDPMDDEVFGSTVHALIDEAVDYIDGFIAPQRAEATSYYRGDPLGNEEEGRSQVVMTEVRDTTLAMMPGLLRIFTSADNAVEFVPTNPNTVALAEQQTDYANLIFHHDNPGFLILHSVFKDMLVRKGGVVKWYWSDEERVTETKFTGLDQGQVAVLKGNKSVEIISVEDGEPAVVEDVDPQTGQPTPREVPTFDVHIRRVTPKNRVVVEAVPPEEFLISRNARSPYNAPIVAHRALKSVSDLIAMGYDPEEIEDHLGEGDVFVLNTETATRNPAVNSFMAEVDNPDPSQRYVIYVEAWVRVDKDGDGIAELRKVCTIGNSHHVLHDEVTDEVPFAFASSDPEPHMVFGGSIADQTMDLQRIKSNVFRNTLDSLAQTINPRTAVVESQVNMDDVMNTENGGIIRMKQPGMVQPLSEPFNGQYSLPIIDLLDRVNQRRTGAVPQAQGLDPDVLQSTTKEAVNQTVNGSQERVELIARIVAETFMVPMFKGILRTIIKHQDRPRMVKLRGQQWVEIDPQEWDADLECQPNIALGKGTDQEKLTKLGMVIQKQEQILQQLGPTNPLAPLDKYAATLKAFVNLAGFKDAAKYFGDVTPEYMQKLANQPPQPNPQMLLVQIEQAKVQGEIMLKRQQAMHKAQVDMFELQMKNEQMRLDLMARLAEIEAKYGTQVDMGHLQAWLDSEQAMHESLVAAQAGIQQHSAELQQQDVEHQREIAAQVHGQGLDHAAAMDANARTHHATMRGQDVTADVQREAAARAAENEGGAE